MVKQIWGSQVDISTCTRHGSDLYTHTVLHRGTHFLCNYAKGGQAKMGSQMDINRWTIHIHILNNVWEQKWGDWNTNTLPYRGTKVSIKLCIGDGAYMGSQVDINSCTDAWKYSKQGVGTEMRWLGHKHTATHGHPCFHQTMHRGGEDMGSQMDINSCTDACTHSNQGVWPEAGWLGHTH